ncbi:hypothetical protein D3C80_1802500 [compost metagenome]
MAEVDPLQDVAGVIVFPQVRLIVGAQAAAELQAVASVQREGEQAHHQAFVGFRRMLGQCQVVGRVVAAIHVADLQFGLADGGGEGHEDPEG